VAPHATQAIIHEAIAQTSTYEEFADNTLDVAQSTYACANRRTRYRLVQMHTNTPCPMRGPGHVTGLVGQEIAMDELALAVGVDPIELRLRNYADHNPKASLPWSSNRLRECYRTAAERFGWNQRSAVPRSMRDGNELVGYGMATAMNPAPRYPTDASATLLASGSAIVCSATSDMGAGTYTSATQIAAETLRLPIELVSFQLGDSNLPTAKEHGGSTTLASVGPAVRDACLALLQRIEQLAAETGESAEDPFALLRRADLEQLTATASVSAGDWQKIHSSYAFGAVFAEVRLDPELGSVRVARLVGAYDGGRIVNPKLARSQCLGGMVQGIGMALLEAVDWDAHLGRVMNANLAEYLVPVNADVRDLDVIFVDGEEPVMNPIGVKGIAGLGLCGVAPAIANAVWHATGRRMRDLPITPDKLLQALDQDLDPGNPETGTCD
jgi:xanthine dehydrogenase YagR molybdenum-binding subunit